MIKLYIKKVFGYVLPCENDEAMCKARLDVYYPPTVRSRTWKHWVTQIDLNTCSDCRNKHGKIYALNATPAEVPPLHPNCQCKIKTMRAVPAGSATKDGKNGADWWIKLRAILPSYYLPEKDLLLLGWRWGKSPAKFAPGKMLTKGIYQNEKGLLPKAPGRTWQEADINYYEGKRNGHRLLWSNDGLVFVTYDHYKTFMEVI